MSPFKVQTAQISPRRNKPQLNSNDSYEESKSKGVKIVKHADKKYRT